MITLTTLFAYFLATLYFLELHSNYFRRASGNLTIIEPTQSNSTTFFEVIDHCVTNYFIVFQNCFIFAFGSTCYIIDDLVLAYFVSIDHLFKYLTLFANHIFTLPNSIIVFLLIITYFPIPKRRRVNQIS